MNEENNNQARVSTDLQVTNQAEKAVTLSRQSGERVLQPSESIKQELQSIKQAQAQVTQPPISVSQIPQPISSPTPASVYPQPTLPAQIQVGMSASQMGYNQPKSKLVDFNLKQLIIRVFIILVILGGIFVALILTNFIALSEFKSVGYTNSQGTSFKVDFYSKHGSKQLNSGNKQLVSRVSKDNKFPIVLSISTVDDMSGYNRAKDCNSFNNVIDVQNSSLNQKISVCDFGKQANLPAGSVYIAGFMHEEKAHIVTIGQDYGNINLSSPSSAQESLTKFGMEPYRADIERIVASIKVE